jgi:cytochrome c-type biogenesis protein
MGLFAAFGHGFASFFSIWQVCILQISPFFLAYATGLYFAEHSDRTRPGMGRRAVLPALFFMAGFCVVYALSSVTGLPIGRFLSYNSGMLAVISGVYILAVSLFIVLRGRLARPGRIDHALFLGGGSLVLGAAFALVYSPCVTPALSEILGMTFRPETAVRGGVLAFFYALGLSSALGLTGVVLVLFLRRLGAVSRNFGRVRDAGGAILSILGLLNVSGLMIQYKAFVLGFLVT